MVSVEEVRVNVHKVIPARKRDFKQAESIPDRTGTPVCKCKFSRSISATVMPWSSVQYSYFLVFHTLKSSWFCLFSISVFTVHYCSRMPDAGVNTHHLGFLFDYNFFVLCFTLVDIKFTNVHRKATPTPKTFLLFKLIVHLCSIC